uniref:Uncharacterized protein n=1 Tax=Globodera rostochiensis TaxID=31243 RepID=A0A914HT45_GLORO
MLFCTTLAVDVPKSTTGDDALLLKLEGVAKQFAEQIGHCQFTFGPLPFPEDIQSPQKRWEATRQEATLTYACCKRPRRRRREAAHFAEENLPTAREGYQELRLLNHRVCLLRLMANLREKAAHTFYFMPGFIGYNEDVAKNMIALYKDMKNQTLIDAVIDGELLLDKTNSTSSSSLHGNLLASDGKTAMYFIIQTWDKSLPECADDSFGHVMIKNGNAMDRTAPTCRPKWELSRNALDECCRENMVYTITMNDSRIIRGKRSFNCFSIRLLKRYKLLDKYAITKTITVKSPGSPKFAFVTAADDAHYPSLRRLLANIKENFGCNQKIIAYDLGTISKNNEWMIEINSVCNLEWRVFDFAQMDEGPVSNLESNAWKIFILAEVFSKFDTFVWLDTSILFDSNNLAKFLKQIPRKIGSVQLPSYSGHGMNFATHPGMYEFLPLFTNYEANKTYELTGNDDPPQFEGDASFLPQTSRDHPRSTQQSHGIDGLFQVNVPLQDISTLDVSTLDISTLDVSTLDISTLDVSTLSFKSCKKGPL